MTFVEWSVKFAKSGESSGNLFTNSGSLVKVLLGAFLRESVALLGAEWPLDLVPKTARVKPLLGHCKTLTCCFLLRKSGGVGYSDLVEAEYLGMGEPNLNPLGQT